MLSRADHPLLNPNQALADLVIEKAYGPEGREISPPEVFVEADTPHVTRSLLARLTMQDTLKPPSSLTFDHQVHVVTTAKNETSSHDVYLVASVMGKRATTWTVNLTTNTARTEHVDPQGNKSSGRLRMTEVHTAVGYF